jgi:hypothetical protein
MADYYTKFSLVLALKHPQHQQYAIELAAQAHAYRAEDQPVPDHFPAHLAEFLEAWSFETELEQEGLWLHSEEGGIDAVCAFIQHLLAQFDPQGNVSFEWSNDCSKPRVDAYGGGAAFITAYEIKTLSTGEWLNTVKQGSENEHLFNPHTDSRIHCGQSAEDDLVENTPCQS